MLPSGPVVHADSVQSGRTNAATKDRLAPTLTYDQTHGHRALEGKWQPGVPADRRLGSKRLRDSASTLGDFELSAARVVARYLGERVELIDDGSADALVDGRIVYHDRAPGVFEVVTNTDPKWAATYDAIRRREFEVRTARVTRHWQAHLRRSLNLRTLEAQAPPLLAQLESAGLLFERYSELDDLAPTGDVAIGKLAKLGIASLYSRSLLSGEEPRLQIIPEGTGGFARDDWSGFHRELSSILHGTALGDVRSKLAACAASVRHIFLGLTMTSSRDLNYWLKADQNSLPTDPPALPWEATHLWIWGMYPIGRVLAWFPGQGWFDPSANWATE